MDSRIFQTARGACGAAVRSAAAMCLIAIAVFAFSGTVQAQSMESDSRYAAFVIDYESGAVLFDKHADARRYPASLTKMMTLYMTFDSLERGRLKLDQKLTVSQRAAGMPPSKLGIPAGKTITVRDAIYALITRSANDIAVVLAEAQGGTESKFGQMMTDRARKIGMPNSTFRNASGLPDNQQVTTARDMSRLAIRLMRDYPQYYDMFKVRSFTHQGRTYANHNRLLGNYEGTDGIKTGFIRASGFNLVASAKRNDRRLIGVVMGGRTGAARDAHMMDILDVGFAQVEDLRVAKAAPIPSRKPMPEVRPQVVVADATTSVVMAEEDATAEGDTAPLPSSTALWGVQVGAFGLETAARQAVASAQDYAPKVLGGAQRMIERAKPDSKPLFRARLVGLSESEARQACTVLKTKKMPCVPVPPEAGVSVASRG